MSTTAAAPPPPPSYPNLHGRSFAITGGCGYVGHRIALHLLAHGATLVRRLDVMAPRPHAPSAFDPKPLGSETLNALFETRTEYERCDLRDREAVRRGLRGVDAVFHVASFGMSGRDMLNTAMVMAVNVDGTRHVLDAANELGVQAVCYTSTTNVCFSGRPLVNQDERLPYVPDHQHVDYYSRTKCIAEQLVLQAARDTSHTRARALRTCAIRPAGIYGEAEERHLPRIVALMRRGLFCFTIGSPDSLVEFVYVDNLVHAHLLAVDKLLSSDLPSPPSTPSSSSSSPWSPGLVNGEAFFISDCQPINNFEFFRPLLLGLGYSYPRLRLPFLFMYYLAFMIELVHHIVSPIYNFQPLTRAEVCKVGVTHYFKPDKARIVLGYEPLVPPEEAMRRVVDWFQHEQQQQQQQQQPRQLSWWVVSAALLVAIAYSLFLSNV